MRVRSCARPWFSREMRMLHNFRIRCSKPNHARFARPAATALSHPVLSFCHASRYIAVRHVSRPVRRVGHGSLAYAAGRSGKEAQIVVSKLARRFGASIFLNSVNSPEPCSGLTWHAPLWSERRTVASEVWSVALWYQPDVDYGSGPVRLPSKLARSTTSTSPSPSRSAHAQTPATSALVP